MIVVVIVSQRHYAPRGKGEKEEAMAVVVASLMPYVVKDMLSEELECHRHS